jgi:hypothetical protein
VCFKGDSVYTKKIFVGGVVWIIERCVGLVGIRFANRKIKEDWA